MKRATGFLGAMSLIMAMLACNPPFVGRTAIEAVPTGAAFPTEAPPLVLLSSPATEVKAPFELTSSAFADKGGIPQVYTCRGQDISPPLAWGDPPDGTESFALIMDDPDALAGLWIHWLIYNIPAEARGLPEALPRDEPLMDGSLQGRNSWSKIGYGGPCPPPGTEQRFFFRLYALDAALDLSSGATRPGLLWAMRGHVLAQLELMGTYSK